MSKLTSKMKSTHKIGLKNKRINYLRFVVRQTSGSHVILFFFFQKLARMVCSRILVQRVYWLIPRRIGPSLQLMAPSFNAQLNVVPYRGNTIVLEPKIGRRTRFISCEGKECLSVKIEIIHSSFMWRGRGFPGNLQQIQARQSHNRITRQKTIVCSQSQAFVFAKYCIGRRSMNAILSGYSI